MKAITIDGLSTNGKTILAKRIADYYGFKYLSTGFIYRAITYYIISNKIDIKDISKYLESLNIEINNDQVILNNKDITNYLRTNNISYYASKWASNKDIRDYALKYQLNYIDKNNTVLDGRNVGVYISNANVKFYLYASIDTRINRLKEKNPNASIEELTKYIKELDKMDIELGNLQIANEAIRIDTTNMTIDEVFNEMIKHIDNIKKCED